MVQRSKVLVIEGNDAVRGQLTTMLTNRGFGVTDVSTVVEGFKVLEEDINFKAVICQYFKPLFLMKEFKDIEDTSRALTKNSLRKNEFDLAKEYGRTMNVFILSREVQHKDEIEQAGATFVDMSDKSNFMNFIDNTMSNLDKPTPPEGPSL